MNAAIVGATGLVGQALLAKLLADCRYQQVYVIGRNPPKLAITAEQLTDPQQPLSTDTKLQYIAMELADLATLQLPVFIDHAYCALGTTIKKAGSQTAFIKVDKTAVIDFSHSILTSNKPFNDNGRAQKLMLVTALGANPSAKVFYNRVKGEVEQAMSQLPFTQISVFQPSLLLGKRDESRPLEDLGQRCFSLLSGFFIGPLLKYKPISAEHVASNMHHYAFLTQERISYISNQTMQQKAA